MAAQPDWSMGREQFAWFRQFDISSVRQFITAFCTFYEIQSEIITGISGFMGNVTTIKRGRDS